MPAASTCPFDDQINDGQLTLKGSLKASSKKGDSEAKVPMHSKLENPQVSVFSCDIYMSFPRKQPQVALIPTSSADFPRW